MNGVATLLEEDTTVSVGGSKAADAAGRLSERLNGHGNQGTKCIVSIFLIGPALETWLWSHQGMGERFVMDKRACFKTGSISSA